MVKNKKKIIEEKEFIKEVLNDIKNEQHRIIELFDQHSKDDKHAAIALSNKLTTIQVTIATLEQKVNTHSSMFNKVWALIAPIIVSIGSFLLFFRGGK